LVSEDNNTNDRRQIGCRIVQTVSNGKMPKVDSRKWVALTTLRTSHKKGRPPPELKVAREYRVALVSVTLASHLFSENS